MHERVGCSTSKVWWQEAASDSRDHTDATIKEAALVPAQWLVLLTVGLVATIVGRENKKSVVPLTHV